MFISDKFSFNGIHSDEMGVALVTFDSGIINDYGFDYTEELTLSKTYKDMSHFTSEHGSIDEKVLNIALIDKYDNPLKWDDDTIMEVTDWLITDGFKEFVSEDNVDISYYFKVKKIVKKFTRDRRGYLEVTVQPFSNNGYKKVIKKVTVDGEKEFTFFNPSNIREPYVPVVEMKNLGDNLNIVSIENKTLGTEPFTISDLDIDDTVIIDGLMGTVYNGYKENKLMNCNRKWFSLDRGKNTIKISGKVELTFKCQFPIRL